MLIDDWKQAHKFASVLILAALAAFDAAWALWPEMQSTIQPQFIPWVNAAGAALAVFARIVRQNLSTTEEDSK